jgi:sodium transport system ATP-binding protein
VIAFERLCKRYGSTLAVDSVSFVAPDGMVTGLLGPNGAGKTTALRALAGLVTPDAGRASIDGRDVRRDPCAARTRLGLLPEAAGLYDRLTAREHLEYSAELHGLAARERDARVDALLDRLRLTAIAGRPAGQLSLGQRRRVALARALVHDPPNVVLDEPTNGLDVLGARDVRHEIRRLAAAGRAVVLATHVMPDVSAVCDRIVILAHGRVLASGAPDAILARAGTAALEDAFVALIGSGEGLQ